MAAKEDSGVNCVVGVNADETENEEISPSYQDGQMFSVQEMEDMKQEPRPTEAKPKTSGIKVFWKKINDFCGDLYDTVNKDIENEKA